MRDRECVCVRESVRDRVCVCVCVCSPVSQGLYAIARSAGALMFQSNPSSQFLLPNGEILTENLYGFPIVPDDTIVTQDVVAVGFDCGAPPEPSVTEIF